MNEKNKLIKQMVGIKKILKTDKLFFLIYFSKKTIRIKSIMAKDLIQEDYADFDVFIPKSEIKSFKTEKEPTYIG